MSDEGLMAAGLAENLRLAREALAHPQDHPHPVDDGLDAEAMAEYRRQGIEAMKLARWSAVIPSRFLEASLEDFDGDEAATLSEWADNPAGRNLIISGPVGSGKSHSAIAAVRQHVLDHSMGVEFHPVGEMLDALDWRRPESGATMGRLCEVDRLVIDDLGAERGNEWTAERLYLVINRRWLEERSTVVTTNLTASELRVALGERSYSRLVGSDAAILRMTGADRRARRA